MTYEDYEETVLNRLWDIQDGTVLDDAKQVIFGLYYDDGFSVNDAVAYLRCTEEVNPELDEETALKRMKKIREKYVKH